MSPPNRLRRLRFERGMTINEVADGAGVSRATIMRLEAGGAPTARIAKALADFYDIAVVDLLAPEPEPKAAA
jgi:transcriptional regulator with XRE-family HTH domain